MNLADTVRELQRRRTNHLSCAAAMAGPGLRALHVAEANRLAAEIEELTDPTVTRYDDLIREWAAGERALLERS